MARWNYSFFDSGARFNAPDAHSTNMRTLSTFLENPFDDDGISNDELLAFSTDHLGRIVAQNAGGEFNTRITGTTSALALFHDCVTSDMGRLAIRKTCKEAKDNFRADVIPLEVKRIEAGFTLALPAGSPAFTEALPNGRTIYTSCRDDKVESHLQTLLDAAVKYLTVLSPATVTLATNLKANWLTIFQASEASGGNRVVTQEGKRLARENLQLMLYLNLVKIMELFPRQPEKLSLYMQQHLLENPSSPDEPPPPAPPTP